MAITTQRDIELKQLEKELADAGADVSRGLGSFATGDDTTIHTYNANGEIIDLPEAAPRVLDSPAEVEPVNPKIAVIDAMDISDGDKAKLKTLI